MKTIVKTLCIVLFLGGNVLGQSLSLGIGTGISIVQGHNYFTNNLGPAGLYFVNGTEAEFNGLKFKNENDFAFNIKYGFKYLPISIVTQIHYMPLRGNQSVNIYDSFFQQNILYDITTKIDIWSLNIGVRYATEIFKVKPYLAASMLLDYFGDTWLEFENGNNLFMRRDYQNGMRYGLCFGIGLGYEAIKNIDVEIGANYNYMNLWNRRGANPMDEIHPSVEERMNILNIELSVYYNIL